MIVSRLNSKAQTTIPKAVRTALGLYPGDEIAYVVWGDHVTLARMNRSPARDPFALFDEWRSPGDEAAYDDL